MSVLFELIGENNSFIKVEVLRYAYSQSDNYHDANWLVCNVSVKVGPFSAKYEAYFETYGFFHLMNDIRKIYENLTGSVNFQPIEEELEFKIEMLKTGKMSVTGIARKHAVASLSFGFESDQSYLAQTLKELEEITLKYPVINLS